MKGSNRLIIQRKPQVGYRIFGGIAVITLLLAQAVSSFGAVDKERFYNASDQLMSYSIHEYNAFGRTSKISSFDSLDQLMSYSIYEYNASGRTSKISSFDSLDQLISYNTYEYNVSCQGPS